MADDPLDFSNVPRQSRTDVEAEVARNGARLAKTVSRANDLIKKADPVLDFSNVSEPSANTSRPPAAGRQPFAWGQGDRSGLVKTAPRVHYSGAQPAAQTTGQDDGLAHKAYSAQLPTHVLESEPKAADILAGQRGPVYPYREVPFNQSLKGAPLQARTFHDDSLRRQRQQSLAQDAADEARQAEQQRQQRRAGVTGRIKAVIGATTGIPDLLVPDVVSQTAADVGGGLTSAVGSAISGAARPSLINPIQNLPAAIDAVIPGANAQQMVDNTVGRGGRFLQDTGNEASDLAGAPDGVRRDIGRAVGGLAPLLIAKNPVMVGTLTYQQARGQGADEATALEHGLTTAATVGAMGGAAKVISRAVPEAGAAAGLTRFGMRAAANTAAAPLIEAPGRAIRGESVVPTDREKANAAVMGTGFALMPHPIESPAVRQGRARAQYEASRAAEESAPMYPRVKVAPTEAGVESAISTQLGTRQPLSSPRLVQRGQNSSRPVEEAPRVANPVSVAPSPTATPEAAAIRSRLIDQMLRGQFPGMKASDRQAIVAEVNQQYPNGANEADLTKATLRAAATRRGTMVQSQPPAESPTRPAPASPAPSQAAQRGDFETGLEGRGPQTAPRVAPSEPTPKPAPAITSAMPPFLESESDQSTRAEVPAPSYAVGDQIKSPTGKVFRVEAVSGDQTHIRAINRNGKPTGRTIPLRPDDVAQFEKAETKPITVRAVSDPRVVNSETHSLTDAISILGFDSTTPEGKDLAAYVSKRPGTINNNRLPNGEKRGIDNHLIPALQDLGYDVTDANDLFDKVTSQKPIYSQHYYDAQAARDVQSHLAAEHRAWLDDKPDSQGHSESDILFRAGKSPEFAGLLNRLHDPDATAEDEARFYENATQAHKLPDDLATQLIAAATQRNEQGINQHDVRDIAQPATQTGESGQRPPQRGAGVSAAAQQGDVDGRQVKPATSGLESAGQRGDQSRRRDTASALPGIQATRANGRNRSTVSTEGQGDVNAGLGDLDRGQIAANRSENLRGNRSRFEEQATARPAESLSSKDRAESPVSTDDLSRVQSIFDSLKDEARDSNRRLTDVVEDRINQQALPGFESQQLTPDDAALLRQMATRAPARAPVAETQAPLLDTAPTVESRAEQAEVTEAKQGQAASYAPLFEGKTSIREQNDALLAASRKPGDVEAVSKLTDELSTLESQRRDISRQGDLATSERRIGEITKELARLDNEIEQRRSALDEQRGRKVKIGHHEFSVDDLMQPAFGYRLKKRMDGTGATPIKNINSNRMLVLTESGNVEEWQQPNTNGKVKDATITERDYDQNDKSVFDVIKAKQAEGAANAPLFEGATAETEGKPTRDEFVESRYKLERGAFFEETKNQTIKDLQNAQTQLEQAKTEGKPRVLKQQERAVGMYEQQLESLMRGKFPDETSADILIRARLGRTYEDEYPHHSQIQPRTAEGQFDGPPDYALTPPKTKPPANTPEGKAVSLLHKQEGGNFFNHPAVKKALSLDEAAPSGEVHNALRDLLAPDIEGEEKSLIRVGTDGIRKWAQANGLPSEVIDRIEQAERSELVKALKDNLAQKNQHGSGGPDTVNLLTNAAKLGASYLRQGVKDFQAWSRRMLADVGEAIRPHLQKAYEAARGFYQDEGGFLRFGSSKPKAPDTRKPLERIGDTASAMNYAGLIGPRNVASVKGGVASSLVMDSVADGLIDLATRRMDAGKVSGGLSPTAMLRASREIWSDLPKNLKSGWQGKEIPDLNVETRNYHPSGLAPFDAVLTLAPRMFGTAEAGIKTAARDLALERMYERAARNDVRDGVIANNSKSIVAQVEAYKNRPTLLGGINAEIASEEARLVYRYEALKRGWDKDVSDDYAKQQLWKAGKFSETDPRELWKALASQEADRAVNNAPNLLSEGIKSVEQKASEFSPATGAIFKITRQIVLPIAKRPAGAIAKFLTDYIGAPLNIPYRAIEGMVNKWDAATTQKFARAVARGGVAYAIVSMGALSHRMGLMTGMLDEDAERRGMLKIGDTYHNVSRIPFFGWLYAMGATIDEAMQKEGNGIGGFAKDVGTGLAHIAGEYPLLRSLKDIGDMKTKGVSGYAGNIAQRAIPKTIESAAILGDPYARQADTPGGKIQARIPVARNYLDTRNSPVTGKPIAPGRLAGILPDVVTGVDESEMRSPDASTVHSAYRAANPLPPMTSLQKTKFDAKKEIEGAMRRGDPNTSDIIKRNVDAGLINDDEVFDIAKTAHQSSEEKMVEDFKNTKSVERKLDVFMNVSKATREKLREELENSWFDAARRLTPHERAVLGPGVGQALSAQ